MDPQEKVEWTRRVTAALEKGHVAGLAEAIRIVRACVRDHDDINDALYRLEGAFAAAKRKRTPVRVVR